MLLGQHCDYDWELFRTNRCVHKIYEPCDFQTGVEKCAQLNASLITLVTDQEDIEIYKMYLHPFFIAINVRVEKTDADRLLLEETNFLYTNDTLPSDKEILYDLKEIKQDDLLCIQYDYNHDYEAESNELVSLNDPEIDVKGEWRIVSCDTQNEVVCEKPASYITTKPRFDFKINHSSLFSFEDTFASGEEPTNLDEIFKTIEHVTVFVDANAAEQAIRSKTISENHTKVTTQSHDHDEQTSLAVEKVEDHSLRPVWTHTDQTQTLIIPNLFMPNSDKEFDSGSILWLFHIVRTTMCSMQMMMIFLYTFVLLLINFAVICYFCRKRSPTHRSQVFYVTKKSHLEQCQWSHKLKAVSNPIYDA